MAELTAFVLGLFLPPLVEFTKTKFANNKVVHYLIALTTTFLVGVISVLINGQFNTSNLDTLVSSIALALASSQSVYNLYWKPKKIDKKFISYLTDRKLI